MISESDRRKIREISEKYHAKRVLLFGSSLDVATAVITEATLVEQPKTKEFEYRIVAVNKAGEGEPSNTEMVVL